MSSLLRLITRTDPAVNEYHSPRNSASDPGVWHREVGLVGGVTDRAVAQFVLVVARRGHPRPVAGRAGVVVEPVRPGADPVVGQVGVAQVAVDQVEQRTEPFDRRGDVAGRRGAEIVAEVSWSSFTSAQRRGRLVSEAGEAKRFSPGRRGSHRSQLGIGAVVHRGVDVVGVGGQVVEPGVVDPDFALGLRVPIGAGLGLHGAAEAGVGVPTITRGL